MILYKSGMAKDARERSSKIIDVSIEEKPQRKIYTFKTNKDRVNFIKKVESTVRRSLEYQEHIKFIKTHLDMNRCAVLRNLDAKNKKYRIEIHHDPFTLYDIVETILKKNEELGLPINEFTIGNEVEELHYEGMIGLIPLSKTMHDLVHADKIFIPLQYIYHSYDKFYNEYKQYINPMVEDKIAAKINLSFKCQDILSDCLDTEFIYLKVEGVNFPEIPNEWKDVLTMNNNK